MFRNRGIFDQDCAEGASAMGSEAPCKRERPLDQWDYEKGLLECSRVIMIWGEISKPPSRPETMSIDGYPLAMLDF